MSDAGGPDIMGDHMKNIRFLLIPLLAVVLSGCSAGGQVDNAVQNPPTIPGGLVSKNEKGSVWKSSDGGRSFQVRSSAGEGRVIDKADILSIAFHPTKPKSVILGTVDDGVFKTDDGGETWMPIEFPPKRIYSFIIDRSAPDSRMFVSGVVNGRGRIFRTDDDGANWREIYVEPGEQTFISSLAQDPRDSAKIYAGTSAGVLLESSDSGETWKNIGGISELGIVSAFAFDATDRSVVSILSFGNRPYRSSDSGKTWSDPTGGNGVPSRPLSLVADPSRSGVLYLGTESSGIYRSVDSGKTWEKLNAIGSAESFPIRSIAVDPKDSSRIVFVSGRTVYLSVDDGSSWTVSALDSDRSAFVVAYDPFDSDFLFLGLRNMK